MSEIEMHPNSQDIFQIMLAHTCRANGLTYRSILMGTAGSAVVQAMYTETELNLNALCKGLVDRKYNFEDGAIK